MTKSVFDQIKRNLQTQFQPDPPPNPFAQPIERNDTDFGTGQITLGTVPLQIVGPRARRGCIKVTNLSSSEVFLGNSSGVSVATGDLLAAGRGQWNKYDTVSAIFGVVASGSAIVAWAEVYE